MRLFLFFKYVVTTSAYYIKFTDPISYFVKGARKYFQVYMYSLNQKDYKQLRVNLLTKSYLDVLHILGSSVICMRRLLKATTMIADKTH